MLISRLLPATACAVFIAGCAATQAPPTAAATVLPAGEGPQPARSGGPSEVARYLFRNFYDRIVEVEEHRSGPGYPVLSGVTLYERPQTTRLSGLCEVRAHFVRVDHVPPPTESPRNALGMHSSTRYFAYGDVGPFPEPEDQPRRCASLSPARSFFTAPSREVALLALQTYTSARRFVDEGGRAASISCTAMGQPCDDPRETFLRILRPQDIASVEQVPCEAGRPGRGMTCFLYAMRPSGSAGSWTVNIKGPERPVHIEIRQVPAPVV